jgi:glucokinase
MTEERKYVIGIDLGGTKIASAVLDTDLKIVSRYKERVGSDVDPEKVFDKICVCIDASIHEAGTGIGNLIGIGMDVPGPLDWKEGIVLETPNLGFKNFPMKQRLEDRFGLPVLLENDVNAGVYGEYVKGAGRGYRHAVGVFPGTGIGGGLVLNGKLFRGASGSAGEIGHMIVQIGGPLCGCGQYGCLEALASRSAIAKTAAGIAASGGSKIILEKAGTDIKKIKSGTLYQAWKAGEKPIIELIDRSARFLGIGLANCVNLFNPEVVILGGGIVEKFGDVYVKAAEKAMREHAMEKLVEGVKVIPAELGDDAAVVGSASLILEAVGS